VTDRKFEDFKLHVEFRYPKESKQRRLSRGRDEVAESRTISAMSPGMIGSAGSMEFISPSEMAARPAGEWAVVRHHAGGENRDLSSRNGRQVICNQEIPGITGGALDSHEGEPGPLFLQGDHGPIEYRNIVITPAR